MENQNNLEQDCDCEKGCCTHQNKTPAWKKWLFIAIIFVAIAIIFVKLTDNSDAFLEKCCDTCEISEKNSNLFFATSNRIE